MTPEQTKITLERLKTIQDNMDLLLKEDEESDNKLKEKYQDLYIAIGHLTVEFHAVLQELKEIKRIFKKESENVVEQVTGSLDQVEQTLGTKEVYLIKKDSSLKTFLAKLKLWKKPHHKDI